MTQNKRPPAGSTGTLRMEEGKYYITRDGQKEGPMVCRSDFLSDDRPWCVELGTGRCWSLSGKGNSGAWDIIEEWPRRHPAHIITHNGREYDLTAMETPFGLLPEPVQDALQAWPHGVEIYIGKWKSVPLPLWLHTSTYRARPAPVETRVPCQRGLAAFRSDMEFGTCIKSPDGSIDWTTWEPHQ